jgi:hypothetical protein
MSATVATVFVVDDDDLGRAYERTRGHGPGTPRYSTNAQFESELQLGAFPRWT